MSKDRLSKLQKWILIAISTDTSYGGFDKSRIYREYFQVPHGKSLGSKPVTVSRSIKRLIERELMTGFSLCHRRGCFHLTDKGKETAKSLTLTSMEINNKEQ